MVIMFMRMFDGVIASIQMRMSVLVSQEVSNE